MWWCFDSRIKIKWGKGGYGNKFARKRYGPPIFCLIPLSPLLIENGISNLIKQMKDMDNFIHWSETLLVSSKLHSIQIWWNEKQNILVEKILLELVNKILLKKVNY